MSMSFLQGLNMNRTPAFSRFLAGFDREPNICWYPSAGQDFRDVLYLSRAYAKYNPATGPEADPPDLFLRTDYNPWDWPEFLEHSVVHKDARTVIRVKKMEEVARIPLPLHEELVYFSEPNENSGRIVYLRLSIDSDRFGSLPDAHVLYAFVENSAFCAEVMSPSGARLSHLINVRYQCGWSGGSVKSRGNWMSGVIGRLGCRTLITDRNLGPWEPEDHVVARIYPNLSGPVEQPPSRVIRTVSSLPWAWYKDVRWVRVGDGA